MLNGQDDANKPERRISQQEIIEQIRANKDAIEELQKGHEDLAKLLEPVAEFYKLMRSDIDTLGRFGRGMRSLMAWGAAIIISGGIIWAWFTDKLKIG